MGHGTLVVYKNSVVLCMANCFIMHYQSRDNHEGVSCMLNCCSQMYLISSIRFFYEFSLFVRLFNVQSIN